MYKFDLKSVHVRYACLQLLFYIVARYVALGLITREAPATSFRGSNDKYIKNNKNINNNNWESKEHDKRAQRLSLKKNYPLVSLGKTTKQRGSITPMSFHYKKVNDRRKNTKKKMIDILKKNQSFIQAIDQCLIFQYIQT